MMRNRVRVRWHAGRSISGSAVLPIRLVGESAAVGWTLAAAGARASKLGIQEFLGGPKKFTRIFSRLLNIP